MNKKIPCGIFLLAAFPLLLPAQADQKRQPAKNQFELENEVYAGYGIGSILTFTSGSQSLPSPFHHSDPGTTKKNVSSFGDVFIGYNRGLSKLVTVGFLAGYMNYSYDLVYEYQYYPPSTGTTRYDENLYTGMTMLRLNYINRPVMALYSGMGIGITLDYYSVRQESGAVSNDRKLKFAAQLTLMGIRFGRAFGGFLEIGVGTNSLVSGGLSYKFSD